MLDCPAADIKLQRRRQIPKVIIYTDGSCIGKPGPGPGGYGIVLLYGNHYRKELSGGYRETNAPRMELLAAIKGLTALNKPCEVILHSDATYVVKNKDNAKVWQANEWRVKDGGKCKNQDLWELFLPLLDKHQVEFKKVKAHSGNEENERCDTLAKTAARGRDLPRDNGFEDRE